MRYFFTLLFAAVCLNAVGQSNPNYNPDYDADGFISVNDVLGVLSTFGDTWDSGDVMVIEITPITNDNIHEAVDFWLSDECSATLTYGYISDWDVSSVTNMDGLFREAASFNSDISSWNVSNVTNMGAMFEDASSFNGDLSEWDVSSVDNMRWMFENASSFNGVISSWDVSSVLEMQHMFFGTSSFNGNISSWDVSSVTNMKDMFTSAASFDGDISSWDVSSVTDMSYMFRSSGFNGDISSWDVSSVTSMLFMFQDASSFNGDISSWDVSSVTQMDYMFNVASNFNQDLSDWDVSNVSSMVHMFNDADAFNGDISSWDVANVTNMEGTFYSADSFNQDISSWDVSQVTNMPSIFEDAASFNQDISSWEVSNVITMVNMLNNTALSEENQCLIHTSFSSNSNWPYDWSEFCSPAVFNSCGDDIGHEGYDYSTVLIGDQCWFSENCRYLPEVSPSSEGSETDPYYYVYDYEGSTVSEAKATENYETYGVLYNWPAVMTEGICPIGWHIPSDEEWMELEMFLGMSEPEATDTGWRGSSLGNSMKSTSGWYSGGNGTNSSGFNALPGGLRSSAGVNQISVMTYWWSSTDFYDIEYDSYRPWERGLDQGHQNVFRFYDSKYYAYSARCIKD